MYDGIVICMDDRFIRTNSGTVVDTDHGIVICTDNGTVVHMHDGNALNIIIAANNS